MKDEPKTLAAISVLFALLAAGCTVAPEKGYPVKRQYVLQVKRDSGLVADSAAPGLRVRLFRASSPFSGTQLVYRRGDVTFETDFYNEFLAPPASMITAQVRQWLGSGNVFGGVVDVGSLVNTRYLLEGNIIALHGDYSDGDKRAAVLEIQFFLIDDSGNKSAITFHKTYRETAALASGGPATLIKGFNTCLEEMLKSLEADLKTALGERAKN